jgi:phosphate acetyltransferase
VSRSLYVAASEAESGKSAVALGLFDLMSRRVGRAAPFRPVVRGGDEPDPVVTLLRTRYHVDAPYESCVGVTYDDVHADPDRAMGEIVSRYRALERDCDAILVVGTDFTDVGAPTELSFNARLAANLGSPVLAVVTGSARSADDVLSAVELTAWSLSAEHAHVVGVVINRAEPDQAEALRERLRAAHQDRLVAVVPDEPLLTAPTVGQVMEACEARMVFGDPDLLSREALGFVVAAMTLPRVLDYLEDGAVVITPGDREEVLVGVLMAHRAETFPALAGVVLTGGIDLDESVRRLVDGLGSPLPVAATPENTFVTAQRASAVRGAITGGSDRKVETALALFERHVDGAALLDHVDLLRTDVITPLMFSYDLVERARAGRRRIVLPESDDERVLRAADVVLRRGVADVVLLGRETDVRARAADLGLDLSKAEVVDPYDPEVRDRLAAAYAELRAHKGVNRDMAADAVVDVSYCGTMMVQLGMADGMVSGAAHTTAHTVRPAFEIIRTADDVSVVSSVFFMCLADRVLVYGDCAIVPDPTAEQLADIAASSATTAERFGIAPRVAMLSYSTGESGSGAEVDKVRRATALVRERRPDLDVEGPIQYDAAVDASVARTKLPESEVAGRATVFVFPDLNTGNNTYKAVQRSAGAVAVGPVLQGLRKPVNDLSRGATVQDIVDTIAITAIQAQGISSQGIPARGIPTGGSGS